MGGCRSRAFASTPDLQMTARVHGEERAQAVASRTAAMTPSRDLHSSRRFSPAHPGWPSLSRIFGALAAALAFTVCAPPASVTDGDWNGRVLFEPLAKPDFVLTDTDGEPFDFRAETEGHLTLLFFGYTYCPDVCPVHMSNLATVLADLPVDVARGVKVVFVTTDPERDTPERLSEWLAGFDRSFIGLRGTAEEINRIEGELLLPTSIVQANDDPSEYFVGHAAQVIAFGPDGVARVVYPWGTRQRDWVLDLPRLAAGDLPAPSG